MAERSSQSRRTQLLVALLAAGVLSVSLAARADVSTPEDRAALFDEIMAKTLRREAFSPVKNRALGLDPEREMRRFRDEVVAARSDEDLFYALLQVSNARKDRHLTMTPVPGGLQVEGIDAKTDDNYPIVGTATPHASLRLAVDYSAPTARFLFVADRVKGDASAARAGLGDKVVSVNGQAFDAYLAAVQPYHRYSSIAGLWDKLAYWLPQKSPLFPKRFYAEKLTLGLERKNGTRYVVEVPYLDPRKAEWEGTGARRYPGFSPVYQTATYDLFRHDSKKVLLLAWHTFGGTMLADMDRLVDHADKNGWLDHDIVWDGTRSRGGSKGAYAIQRLQPRPFKTTLGNLRISDVTQPFIDQQRERFKKRQPNDAAPSEALDGGRWLIDWLEDDVTKGLQAGQAYTNAVPFKLAHLPKWSDGVVKPAKVHFRGRLVCLFGPYGGSHLDQFAAIVADNDLGHTIGMPTGGYSNTWEWEETLVFPISKKPVVQFMWDIGHTIRPNGAILEGEAAAVKELIPQSRENYAGYYPLLVSRALKHLGLE